MADDYKISQTVSNIRQDRRIKAIYGYIMEVLNIEEEDYYIPLVALENHALPVDTQCHYIPLDETPEQLASNYGEPRDLIGLRVRVEYYGTRWRTGVARIVPGRTRRPVGTATEIPSRGFRFAVAGGGSV
jgi:hypothetical protein